MGRKLNSRTSRSTNGLCISKGKEKDSEIQIEDVIKFFVNFIEMDQLGRIANAHVAISDQSKLGVRDPTCIQLSKAFSLAVDFPKTGVLAQLPNELKKVKYPDFMEKNGDSYKSEKIIGKMYRKCKSIFLNEYYSDQIEINKSFLVQGYEKYLPQSQELYSKYRHELERIMHYFGCWQESEIFIGLYLNSSHSEESRDFQKLSHSMIKKLWNYMRSKFFELAQDSKEIAFQIASAWYFVCYSSAENKNLRILSFPWILEDVLHNFKIENYDHLSKSIVDKFCSSRDDLQMISRYIQKIEFKNEIEKILDLKLLICGSFGLFLFEQTNEIQIFVYNPNESTWPLLDESKKDLLEEYFDCVSFNDGILSCQESEEILFTINESLNSVKRFLYLRKSIFKNVQLLPVFYSIVHFARLDGLFLTLSQEKIKLDNYLEFCFDFFLQKNLVTSVSDLEVEQEFLALDQNDNLFDLFEDWSKLHDKIDRLEDSKAKEMILRFYKENCFDQGKIIFNFRFENKQIYLDEKLTEMIRNHFFKIFNYISKASRISDIWSCVNQIEEPVFKRKYSIMRKKGKSPNMFVENASLLLFSNVQSEYDQVEFELYQGKRRSMHLSKQCHLAKISRPLENYTDQCFNEFYYHSIKQINKAKEMKSDFVFRFVNFKKQF